MPELELLLQSVPWELVEHAYGVATDTPQLLRNLRDRRRSKVALDKLFSSINHQGGQYEAGIDVCPILLELINDPRLPNLHRVLDLILGIAVGFPAEVLCSGDDITSTLRLPYSKNAASRAQLEQWQIEKKCYAAARCGIEQFVRLLDHASKCVAWQAAYNLAWFPRDASRTLEPLRHKCDSAKAGTAEDFANYVLPMGLLEWHAGRKRGSRRIICKYLSSSERLVRYAAAIYCGWFGPDDEVQHVLEELSTDEDFDSCVRAENIVLFCDGNLMWYAECFLERLRRNT